MLNSWNMSVLACIAVVLPADPVAAAREIHVAKTGNDANAGSPESPYLTIGKAAEAAQPGDTVIVHAGTYREWVKPPRGGRDENSRITYRAAAGEEVLIKGSEQITSWVDQGGGVWMVATAEAVLRRLQPLRPEHLRRLAPLRPVAAPRRCLPGRRGVLRAEDPGGGETAGAHLVLPGSGRQHHHLGELRQGESQHAARRDQRPRKRLHAGGKRAELHHGGRLSPAALRRELAAAGPASADGSDRPAHGQALDHRELHGHQCPLRGHRRSATRRAWITPTSTPSAPISSATT